MADTTDDSPERSITAHGFDPPSIHRLDIADLVHRESDRLPAVVDPSVRCPVNSPSRAPRSMTVTIAPRRLISPHTYSGAPGSRVARRTGMISRTGSMAHAYTRPDTTKSSRR